MARRILLILCFCFCLSGLFAQGQRTIRVGLLLPFKSKEAIGARSVEFYRGFLMAVDSLRQKDVRFEIETNDCGISVGDFALMLATQEKSNYDLIIGPSDEAKMKMLNDFSAKKSCKLLMPFGGDYSNYIWNSNFFVMRSAKKDYAEKIYQKMDRTFRGENRKMVLFKGIGDEHPVATILKAKDKKIKTISKVSQAKKLYKSFGTTPIVIIPSSNDNRTRNNIMTIIAEIKQKYPQMDCAMFDWSGELNNEEFDRYTLLTEYCDMNKPENKAFAQKYTNQFNEPFYNESFSFILYGFDTGYYLLNGLLKYGKQFADQTMDIKGMQNDFDFVRISDNGALLNTSLIVAKVGKK